jgi:hypothetical protein
MRDRFKYPQIHRITELLMHDEYETAREELGRMTAVEGLLLAHAERVLYALRKAIAHDSSRKPTQPEGKS